MDDLIKRIEFKAKEEREVFLKYMVVFSNDSNNSNGNNINDNAMVNNI